MSEFSGSLIDTSKDGPPEVPGAAPKETSPASPTPAPAQAAGQPPAAPDTPRPEAEAGTEGQPPVTPQEPPKFKVKAAGEEREVTLEELERAYQRNYGLDQRMREIRESEARLQQQMAQLQSNPLAQAVLAGQDPHAIAEQLVWQRIQEQRMPPEQRAALEAQRQAHALQQHIQQLEQQRQQIEAEMQARQFADYYEPVIRQHMQKAGYPSTQYAVDRVLQAFMEQASLGIEVDVAMAVEQAKTSMAEEVARGFAMADPEQILGWIGQETAMKLSQAFAKKLKSQPPAVPDPLRPPERQEPRSSYVSEDDFAKAMSEFRGRG